MLNDVPEGPPLLAGEVVSLTVGGALMTVRCTAVGGVVCDWHDAEGRPHQQTYLRTQLVRMPDILFKARQEETDSAKRALRVQAGGGPLQ